MRKGRRAGGDSDAFYVPQDVALFLRQRGVFELGVEAGYVYVKIWANMLQIANKDCVLYLSNTRLGCSPEEKRNFFRVVCTTASPSPSACEHVGPSRVALTFISFHKAAPDGIFQRVSSVALLLKQAQELPHVGPPLYVVQNSCRPEQARQRSFAYILVTFEPLSLLSLRQMVQQPSITITIKNKKTSI